MRHGAVHQRMGSDEVEDAVRQLPSVLHTGSGSRFWHLATGHRQPGGGARLLLLELSIKSFADIINMEGTDSRTHQTIEVGCKDGIECGIICRKFVHILDFVEVEGKLSWKTAVESGFQICCPVLVEDVLASCVLLADSGDPGVDALAAVHVLDRDLSEEEVDILSHFITSNKIGFIQHVAVIFDGSLEPIFPPSIVEIVQISSKDDGVCLRELRVGAGVEGGQLPGVAVLHPDGGGVVLRVEWTLGNTIAHPGHVLVTTEVGQVGVDHLVAGIVSVSPAHVQTVSVTNGLDHADVVPAVELLRLALADTLGRVARLQQQAVVVTAGAGHIGQVHCGL